MFCFFLSTCTFGVTLHYCLDHFHSGANCNQSVEIHKLYKCFQIRGGAERGEGAQDTGLTLNYCQWGIYPCVCSSWPCCHVVLPDQLWPFTICSMRWVLRWLAGPRSLRVMFCQAFLARGCAAWADAIFRWVRCHLHDSFQISGCCIVNGFTWRFPWLYQSLSMMWIILIICLFQISGSYHHHINKWK